MASNLFISYDLHEPGKNYDRVIAAIKQLGEWAKVHFSLWYVKSNLSAEQAAKHVWAAMDANDKLAVIEAANANWCNLPAESTKFIQERWYR